MNEARKGDWMQTYTGRQFWPLDPRADEVCIEDIAHSLSLQCRFAGHCREFYSVAEHSVRVSLLVEEQVSRGIRCTHGDTNSAEAHYVLRLALLGLLHDASEAYLVDLPRPVKRHLPAYRSAEDHVMEAICERFGLTWINNPDWLTVKEADNALLATEARDLMAPPPAPWAPMPEPLPERIVPWDQREARARFTQRFYELGGQR